MGDRNSDSAPHGAPEVMEEYDIIVTVTRVAMVSAINGCRRNGWKLVGSVQFDGGGRDDSNQYTATIVRQLPMPTL